MLRLFKKQKPIYCLQQSDKSCGVWIPCCGYIKKMMHQHAPPSASVQHLAPTNVHRISIWLAATEPDSAIKFYSSLPKLWYLQITQFLSYNSTDRIDRIDICFWNTESPIHIQMSFNVIRCISLPPLLFLRTIDLRTKDQEVFSPFLKFYCLVINPLCTHYLKIH